MRSVGAVVDQKGAGILVGRHRGKLNGMGKGANGIFNHGRAPDDRGSIACSIADPKRKGEQEEKGFQGPFKADKTDRKGKKEGKQNDFTRKYGKEEKREGPQLR